MNFTRFTSYVRQNPGFLPVIIFVVLLVTAAFLSIVGDSWASNELAIYAFYSLAAAVALQIAVLLRGEKKGSRTDRGQEDRISNSSLN